MRVNKKTRHFYIRLVRKNAAEKKRQGRKKWRKKKPKGVKKGA